MRACACENENAPYPLLQYTTSETCTHEWRLQDRLCTTEFSLKIMTIEKETISNSKERNLKSDAV